MPFRVIHQTHQKSQRIICKFVKFCKRYNSFDHFLLIDLFIHQWYNIMSIYLQWRSQWEHRERPHEIEKNCCKNDVISEGSIYSINLSKKSIFQLNFHQIL